VGRKLTTTPVAVPRSETVEKMLAYAAKHRLDPVPDRGMVTSAFDHPSAVGRVSAITNNSDRIRMCLPDKPCRICRWRDEQAKRAALAAVPPKDTAIEKGAV